jgi:large subunit ribosomal protein L32
MAVPKKRTGSSAQGHRRSNWKATKPEITKCAKCGEVALTHTVCTACGYYKGKAVSIKSPDYAETKLEEKKAVKKVSKKVETSKEIKVKEVETEIVKTEKVEEEVKTNLIEIVKAEENTETAED